MAVLRKHIALGKAVYTLFRKDRDRFPWNSHKLTNRHHLIGFVMDNEGQVSHLLYNRHRPDAGAPIPLEPVDQPVYPVPLTPALSVQAFMSRYRTGREKERLHSDLIGILEKLSRGEELEKITGDADNPGELAKITALRQRSSR